MQKNGAAIEFRYNADGIRTNKIVNGANHVYTLNGTQIVSEAWGDYLLIYLYDESGSPIGMQYRTSSYAANVFDTFYFEKNLQGDIIAIYTESGRKILEYTYDAWGNHSVTWTYLTMETMQAVYNPFRYRGYYYDTDTQLYYLQSRYYNPAWGRFLNADGYVNANGDLIGFNMYAYCSNNPVMFSDPSGEFALTTAAICIIVGAAIGFCGTVLADYSDDGEVFNGSVSLVGYIGNTVFGGLVGGLLYCAWPVASSFLSSSFSIGIPTFMGEVMGMQMVTISGAQVVGGAILLAAWIPGSWPGDDPTQPPGDDFIWRGPGDVGSEMGEWFNPKTGDQLHPNLNHLPPKKPHWGWRNKLKRILLDIFKN